MALMVYNTLSGEKEEFRPLHGRRAYMFVCGPTVYDASHIGHARTYIVFDVIAKYLRYKGYSLFYLMNVTDIDDKIITRSMDSDRSASEISESYFSSFLRDMGRLGVDSVNLYAKATDHIPEIIDQINALLESGKAYESKGSVYFQVSGFPGFGKLSNQRMDMLEAGARISVNLDKRSPEDFVLWKAYKEGEPWWDSPWGRGRPGWHVEDTAISVKYFGSQYDLHGGGMDLMFPHHDSEIAIAESITDKEPFVKYWLHTGFLNLRGEKMSKSLGNIVTIDELLEKYKPDVLRFFMLNGHYRSPIDFDLPLLDEAKAAYDRLEQAVQSLERCVGLESCDSCSEGLKEIVSSMRKRFEEAMDDDLNTREAMAVLFDLARESNRTLASSPEDICGLREALQLFRDAGCILGLFQDIGGGGDVLDSLVHILLEERESARKKKDWEKADMIRDRLKDAGIILEDGKDGPVWKIYGGN